MNLFTLESNCNTEELFGKVQAY